MTTVPTRPHNHCSLISLIHCVKHCNKKPINDVKRDHYTKWTIANGLLFLHSNEFDINVVKIWMERCLVGKIDSNLEFSLIKATTLPSGPPPPTTTERPFPIPNGIQRMKPKFQTIYLTLFAFNSSKLNKVWHKGLQNLELGIWEQRRSVQKIMKSPIFPLQLNKSPNPIVKR